MIREAIMSQLKARNISVRECALKNGLNYSNFYNFLKGNRRFPLPEIEKVLEYLDLEITVKNNPK